MSRRVVIASMLIVPMLSCASGFPLIAPGVLPVETEFFLLNLTRDRFLTVALRGNDASGAGDARPFVQSPLIPPGAVLRQRFLDLFPETGGCPDRLDVRAHLYELSDGNAQPGSIPINGDPCVDNPPDVSDVDPVAVASAEFLGVSACELIVLSTYTIVLRETEDTRPPSMARRLRRSASVVFSVWTAANASSISFSARRRTFLLCFGELMIRS